MAEELGRGARSLDGFDTRFLYPASMRGWAAGAGLTGLPRLYLPFSSPA